MVRSEKRMVKQGRSQMRIFRKARSVGPIDCEMYGEIVSWLRPRLTLATHSRVMGFQDKREVCFQELSRPQKVSRMCEEKVSRNNCGLKVMIIHLKESEIFKNNR